MSGGLDPSRAFTLACLFSDLHLSLQKSPPAPSQIELHAELRALGFPRGETERMRLLLNALSRLLNPNGRTRGMQRRPYFVEAKALHDLLAAGYSPSQAAKPDQPRKRRRRPSRRRRRRSSGAQHQGANGIAAAVSGVAPHPEAERKNPAEPSAPSLSAQGEDSRDA